MWVERSELRDFDIFTYTFGDNTRLYQRGQWAVHQNNPKVNALWLACPELTQNFAKVTQECAFA
jgi:hypothetical protein